MKLFFSIKKIVTFCLVFSLIISESQCVLANTRDFVYKHQNSEYVLNTDKTLDSIIVSYSNNNGTIVEKTSFRDVDYKMVNMAL